MSLKNKFDSIIFDLDGTLWDSTATVADAWETARQQVNYVPEPITRDMVRSITGMAYDAIFEKLFPSLAPQTRDDFKKLCARHELENLRNNGGHLYPELAETLGYLKTKYRLFIVSNCQSGYIELFLQKHELDNYFEGHQCYGSKSQPKFQNILDVVSGYNLKAPVYIGDTTGDRDAAAKASVPFIFAAYGFGALNNGFISSVTNFADLQKLF